MQASNKCHATLRKDRLSWRRLAAIGACLYCLADASATQLGRPFVLERLHDLAAGTTTTPQIVALLGEPQGHGKAQLTPSAAPQDVLLYEFAEMEGTKARERMLIVFVDQTTGVYQGHLWFAAGHLIVRKE